MRSTARKVRALSHNGDTQPEHAGSLSVHCSTLVLEFSVIVLYDEGDVRDLET